MNNNAAENIHELMADTCFIIDINDDETEAVITIKREDGTNKVPCYINKYGFFEVKNKK